MKAQPVSGAARDLGARLRELRETKFAGVRITQRAFGKALSWDKPLSGPLISSWEKGAAIPAKKWITAYATFFATSRSIENGTLRLLREGELNAEERAARDALHRELTKLRSEALRSVEAEKPDPRKALGGLWNFTDGGPVRIICAELPEDQRHPKATPAHPTLAYGKLYSFSSIDALFELHGHVRAANPHADVRVRMESELEPDDFSAHLVVLGGVDWNPLMSRMSDLLPDIPVRQISTGDDPAKAYFEVATGEGVRQLHPELTVDGELVADVGHFLRVPNPFNKKRTLSICAGMYSLGTLGVVRALTDTEFRDGNQAFLRERFARTEILSVVMSVLILNGNEALTPDWTNSATRLHEWPEAP